MATKHFFESTDGLVEKSLRGTIALNPALRCYLPHKVVYLPATLAAPYAPAPIPRHPGVTIISGGGAGHEPAHAGYVGHGMLAAAVSGNVFASPSADQVRTAIELGAGEMGAVLVVNNYTGDCLNFGLAAETARSQGYAIEVVHIADDVSVPRSRSGLVGRRGHAGNVLVCKILGAATVSLRPSLAQLAHLGRSTAANLVTVAASLDHCHVPGRAKGDKEREAMPEGAYELGLGLHNEPGVRRVPHKPDTAGVVKDGLRLLLDPADKQRAFVPFGSECDNQAGGTGPVLFINNLGGMSVLEFGAVLDEVVTQLESDYSLRPSRIYASTYMTSLNMPGFSIGLLNVAATEALCASPPSSVPAAAATQLSILSLLDAPTTATAWSGARTSWPDPHCSPSPSLPRTRSEQDAETLALIQKLGVAEFKRETGATGTEIPAAERDRVRKAIEGACQRAIDAEPELTEMDTIVGDGDCGETLSAGCKAVLSALRSGSLPLTHSAKLVQSISSIVENTMGGTSGAIYAIFLAGMSKGLLSSSSSSKSAGTGTGTGTGPDWRRASRVALRSLSEHTPARPGDRTLVDALSPFCIAIGEQMRTLPEAVDACRRGAESTRGMKARLGRATYVGDGGGGEGDLGDVVLPPDPGAWGIMRLVEGLAAGYGSV